jgi:hypothetical protein
VRLPKPKKRFVSDAGIYCVNQNTDIGRRSAKLPKIGVLKQRGDKLPDGRLMGARIWRDGNRWMLRRKPHATAPSRGRKPPSPWRWTAASGHGPASLMARRSRHNTAANLYWYSQEATNRAGDSPARVEIGDQGLGSVPVNAREYRLRLVCMKSINPNELPVTLAHCEACVEEARKRNHQWELRAEPGAFYCMGIDNMGNYNVVLILKRQPNGCPSLVWTKAI